MMFSEHPSRGAAACLPASLCRSLPADIRPIGRGLIEVDAGRLGKLLQRVNANCLTYLDRADRLVLARRDPRLDLAMETRIPEAIDDGIDTALLFDVALDEI